MKLKVPTKIEVKDSEIHGLGVFATDSIREGEIIEECHLITLPIDTDTPADLLINYRFKWPQGRPDWREILRDRNINFGSGEAEQVVIKLELENGNSIEATLPKEGNVIPLGYGCVYNHSHNNNAKWINHPKCKAFQFMAIRNIEIGEEICTNYGDAYMGSSLNPIDLLK